MKIERIDHLNLTVADIDRSVEFYQRVLGMKAESMGEGRAALYFGQQKIHLDAAVGAMADNAMIADSKHIVADRRAGGKRIRPGMNRRPTCLTAGSGDEPDIERG